jgi:MFS transporter, ACS family, aldohexuronate transporter
VSGERSKEIRWWIGGLLFASTTINYIDRQALNVLAPYLKAEYRWTNTDFASLVIAFRLAYALMQGFGGRAIDWLGSRRGLAFSVTWYSLASMLTAFAGGLWSFRVLRFLLGTGEGANWPGATKAVAENFPPKERGFAVAFFDSGSAVGGAIAPAFIVWLYHLFGGWRPAFVVTGLFGFVWLAVWLAVAPRHVPAATGLGAPPKASWGAVIPHRQTWGIVITRALLDPYWFFVADWFAIFLTSKGYKIEDTLWGFWLPFVAAQFGSFFGGGLSSWLIHRGWSVGSARRATFVGCGPLMLLLLPASFTSSLPVLLGCFALATFGYAACSAIYLTLPSDLFVSESVATVSGLSGGITGFTAIAMTYSVGYVTDKYSFTPVLQAACLLPVLAIAAYLLLVRNTPSSGKGLLVRI